MEAERITQSSRMSFLAARLECRILGAKECTGMRKDMWVYLQGLLAGQGLYRPPVLRDSTVPTPVLRCLHYRTIRELGKGLEI